MKDVKAGDTWNGAIAGAMLGARPAGIPGLLLGAAIGEIGAYAVYRGPG
jgi:hypothetical protein